MSSTVHRKYKYFHSTVQTAEGRRQRFHFCRCRLMYWMSTILNSRDNSTTMTGFSHTTFENSLLEVSENSGTVATTFHTLCENFRSKLCKYSRKLKLLQTSTKLDNLLKFTPLWSVMHAVKHDSRKLFWLANTYTDACHEIWRWNSANLVSGFSLPSISSSYTARKESLILRLLSETLRFCEMDVYSWDFLGFKGWPGSQAKNIASKVKSAEKSVLIARLIV